MIIIVFCFPGSSSQIQVSGSKNAGHGWFGALRFAASDDDKKLGRELSFHAVLALEGQYRKMVHLSFGTCKCINYLL